jgi:hypothetical protein
MEAIFSDCSNWLCAVSRRLISAACSLLFVQQRRFCLLHKQQAFVQFLIALVQFLRHLIERPLEQFVVQVGMPVGFVDRIQERAQCRITLRGGVEMAPKLAFEQGVGIFKRHPVSPAVRPAR